MKFWLFATLGVLPCFAANQTLLRYLNIGDKGAALVLTADPSGNLFAVTSIFDDSGVLKTRVIKTDPKGNQLASIDLPDAEIQAAATDGSGDVVLAGSTAASPQTTAAIVIKLDPQLQGVAFSKQLGAPSSANAVALDANGNIFIGGSTNTQNLPVTPGAFQTTPPPVPDPSFGGPSFGFLTELSPDGSTILYSTYFGGKNAVCGALGGSDCIGVYAGTAITALAIDAAGNVLMAGPTDATDLPVTPGAFAGACLCDSYNVAGFVAELSPGGSPQLIFSTFINDNPGIPGAQSEQINAMALDSEGNILIGGSAPIGFPTTAGVLEPVAPNGFQGIVGFVLKLNNAGTTLLWSTYFGNSIRGLALDPQGNVVLTGFSQLYLLPGSSNSTEYGAYAARIAADATAVLNLTVGPTTSSGQSLALSPSGNFITLGQSGALWIEAQTNGGSLLGIANAASGPVSGLVAPYELVSLYGTGIGPANPIGGEVKNGAFTTSLAGYQVLFDGIAAPLLYAGPSQINAIVPSAVATEDSTHIQIVSPSGTIDGPTMYVRPAEPSVFESSVPGFDGLTIAAALNQDGTVNSQQNPAMPGSIVTIFATGTGSTFWRDGEITPPDTLQSPLLPVSILFGNESLEITYAGDAPGLVAGVTQINFRLPPSVGLKTFPFTLQAGAALTSALIAVP
ncbi:MAG TPA: SBBP repeat-containing protein [Bryobacteraceae bacterium]|nr:SBBP repeat-containing protein [Bryobacteraceae bacterium]